MILLRLTCPAEDLDFALAELWEAGTVGVQEIDSADQVILAAVFDFRDGSLLDRFAAYHPEWHEIPKVDWVEATWRVWPACAIGKRIFLAAPWNAEPTPRGRVRIIHIPGLASGTGEHSCTQLALIALDKCITPDCNVVDVGTGSGILAMAALKLGASLAIGIDIDANAISMAKRISF